MRRVAAALFLILTALLFSVPREADRLYADVPPADWSPDMAEQAAALGLDGEGRFLDRAALAAALEQCFGKTVEAVSGPLTRAGMAAMLVDALGYAPLAAAEGAASPCPYTDVEAADWGPVALCLRLGLLDAPEGDRFFPDAPAPREQAAALLLRAAEKWNAPVEWLHGFYAFSSYSQIELTAEMDAVSVGWALLDVDGETGPFLNQTSAGGNSWVKPADPTPATGYFQENGTPYHLNIYAGATPLTLADGTQTNDLYGILETGETRARAVDILVAAAGEYDGLTIDIEGLRTPLRESFTAFMTALRSALPADKGLYVCVPPPDWYGGYDYRALGELCDKVILMAHDYQWPSVPEDYVGGTNTATPVTPIANVYSALKAVTDPATGVQDTSKVAIQISIASAGLQVDGDGLLLSRTIYSPGPGIIIKRLRQADSVRGWSEQYMNPYLYYTADDGTRLRLWYEDARSVTAKLRLARLLEVEGVSLWRLGVIPNYDDPGLDYDIWSAVSAGRVKK